MARHKSNGIVQAMQSLRLSSSAPLPPSCLFVRPSAHLPRLRRPAPTRARNYATEVQPAPEIDFSAFARNASRIVPASASYFSGSPRFTDQVLKLEHMQARYASLPTVEPHEAPRMAWLKISQFRDYVGEPVPSKKYKNLIRILQRLNRIRPEMVPDEVRDMLRQFVRPGNPYAVRHVARTVDERGRARAKGKRKESTAVVQLVEGEGEVLVNGKSLVEAFHRVHDRESALWALRCTQRTDKYNAWVRVRGGGVTGQAEATTLAIARALLLHEPGLKPALRKAGVITVDARRVERKKPGRVKARKMPTWVKR